MKIANQIDLRWKGRQAGSTCVFTIRVMKKQLAGACKQLRKPAEKTTTISCKLNFAQKKISTS